MTPDEEKAVMVVWEKVMAALPDAGCEILIR